MKKERQRKIEEEKGGGKIERTKKKRFFKSVNNMENVILRSCLSEEEVIHVHTYICLLPVNNLS